MDLFIVNALRTQVNNIIKELKHKFFIEKNKFLTFQDIEFTIFKNKFGKC